MLFEEMDSRKTPSGQPLMYLGANLDGLPALQDLLEKEGYFKFILDGIPTPRGILTATLELHFESAAEDTTGQPGAAPRET